MWSFCIHIHLPTIWTKWIYLLARPKGKYLPLLCVLYLARLCWPYKNNLIRKCFANIHKNWWTIILISNQNISCWWPASVWWSGICRPRGDWPLEAYMYIMHEQGLQAISYRADSRFTPSQWEMASLCNDVSQVQSIIGELFISS